MKGIRKGTAILMMCLWLPLWAAAQGLTFGEPITGTRPYPEGASLEEAGYVLSYAYPQVEAQSEADEGINRYYQSVAQDMEASRFGALAQESEEMRTEGMPPAYTQIDYQITHNDERYVSVLFTTRQFVGNGEGELLSADTFARDGVYAGQAIGLSQVLGLEEGATAETALNDQLTTAESLAYRLVWEIVQSQMQNVDGDYLDGLSAESVQGAFSPETDFYLDEDGNIVFFIQPGILAGEVAGALRFPFAPAELLSAVRE